MIAEDRMQSIAAELENGDTSHIAEYNTLVSQRVPSKLFGQPLLEAHYASGADQVQDANREVRSASPHENFKNANGNPSNVNEKIALLAVVAHTKNAWERDPDKLSDYTESLSALEQHDRKEKQHG